MGLPSALNALHKRHDARLERGKERVELLGIAALFVVVETGVVVALGVLVAQVDRLPLVADERRERVAEFGKIILLLRRQPVAVGMAGRHVHLKIQLRGDVFHLRVGVVEVLDGFLLHVGEPLAVFVQPAQELHIFRIVRHGVELLAEDRHVLTRLFHALRRRAALHVKAHLAEHARIGLDLVKTRKQLFQTFGIRHSWFSFEKVIGCHQHIPCGTFPNHPRFCVDRHGKPGKLEDNFKPYGGDHT